MIERIDLVHAGEVQGIKVKWREVGWNALIEEFAPDSIGAELLDTGAMQSGSAIACAEKLHHSVVNELLRLTLLAPDIIEQFMAGKQPRRLTLMWFQRNRLMVDWHAQRQLMASFEEDV